jgi:hypothetical protein
MHAVIAQSSADRDNEPEDTAIVTKTGKNGWDVVIFGKNPWSVSGKEERS